MSYYSLNYYSLNLTCDSFFGPFESQQDLEYYAKGYVSWLAIAQGANSDEEVFQLFSNRYKQALEQLNSLGHVSADPKVNTELDAHIEQEWRHFQNGIYGLCTQSGLPEDIAAKELAILEINELTELEQLLPAQRDKLSRAVALLDSASSLFAPHERERSSRYRLVDEVRRKYGLEV